jgi:adenylate kinase family enzyme
MLAEIPLFRKQQTENFIRMLDLSFRGPLFAPRVIVIFGPVGCGKTTLVKAVCQAKGIEIVAFSPDEQWDLPDDSESESLSIGALKTFIDRAQLVTDPRIRRIILLDDLSIDNHDRRQFIEILDRYGVSAGGHFPLVWIPEADCTSVKPTNCLVFNFPPTSQSVLKRVIGRVSNGEGLALTSDQIGELIADNPGDVRLVVNQLQFSRSFVTGNYAALTFFQAVGEVLYNKQRLSAEDILIQSHCSARTIMRALFENGPDFVTDVNDFAEIADCASEADVLMSAAWQLPELGDLAATTVMRGFVVSNSHRRPNLFWSLRRATMSRLKERAIQHAPFLCWPDRALTPEAMDRELFFRDTDVVDDPAPLSDLLSSRLAQLTRAREMDEEKEVLNEDPIEDWDDDE